MNQRQIIIVEIVSKVIWLSIVAIISSECLIILSSAIGMSDYTAALLCTDHIIVCLDAFINALVIYLQFPFSKRYYFVFCGFGHRWINKLAVYRVGKKLMSFSGAAGAEAAETVGQTTDDAGAARAGVVETVTEK